MHHENKDRSAASDIVDVKSASTLYETTAKSTFVGYMLVDLYVMFKKLSKYAALV